MHTHHDTYGKLPFAKRNNPRTVWVTKLWPYVEQQNLYSRYDFTLGVHQPPNCVANTFDGLVAQKVSISICPSDRNVSPYHQGRAGGQLSSTGVRTPILYGLLPAPPPRSARQAYNAGGSTNFPRKRALEISDGTSSTLLMSEVIIHPQAQLRDRRGDQHNDGPGCTIFQTVNTPNSGIDSIIDAIACQNYLPWMPCSPTANGHIAARSRHPSGVMASYCDGSVDLCRTMSPSVADVSI
jgi:prepilin-type processing-associated H-X9-DG protein